MITVLALLFHTKQDIVITGVLYGSGANTPYNTLLFFKKMNWTKEEIEYLKQHYLRDETAEEVAAKLGTTVKAVRNKACRIGVSQNSEFTQEEKDYIVANYKSYNLTEISCVLARPKTSVCRVAKQLGLEMTGKKKEKVKPKRKFETAEELREWKSEVKKEWYKTHEHPRGMLGKHHSREYCEQTSKRLTDWWNNATPDEVNERTRQTTKTKIQNGTLNPNLSRENPYSRARSGKRADLQGMFFRSAWEANIARVLNYENIAWRYEPKTFYFQNSEVVSYMPDFYLPEYDLWVEVKGWMDEKSQKKLKAFGEEYPHEKLYLLDSFIYREVEKEYENKIPHWEESR